MAIGKYSIIANITYIVDMYFKSFIFSIIRFIKTIVATCVI